MVEQGTVEKQEPQGDPLDAVKDLMARGTDKKEALARWPKLQSAQTGALQPSGAGMKKGVLHGLCSIPVNGQRPKEASKAGFEQGLCKPFL